MRYLKITSPDTNNGRGFRVTLWIPGCSHNCPGCHNKWTHDYNAGREIDESVYDDLINRLNQPYIKGLTLSGGDPLDQNEQVLKELSELIDRIKNDIPDIDIWLYTGFIYENLQGLQKDIADKCDVIVDGPYIESQRDISLAFRGSKNQRIIYNNL